MLLTPLLSSCAKDLTFTPHVPDFQLNETRKYNTISKGHSDMGDPKLLSLSAVDGMYCFPKEEIARLVKRLNEQIQKDNSTITEDLLKQPSIELPR